MTQIAGSMTSVTGSIGYVTPGTTEKGYNCSTYSTTPPYCSPTEVANSYSIQLNSGLFNTSLCSGCKGWEQFVYNSEDNAVFIQNWVINPTSTTLPSQCPTPSGWPSTFGWGGPYAFMNANGTVLPGWYCYTSSNNGPLDTSVPTPQQLTGATLTGDISPIPSTNCSADPNGHGSGNGYCDTVVMTTATGYASMVSDPEITGLAGNWAQAEFGIYGDALDDEAYFSSGTVGQPVQIDVQTTVNSPTNLQPTCLASVGLTGESNNLNLPETPGLSQWPGGPPTMTVDQTSTALAPNVLPSCVNSEGWGETHLDTFQGLDYPFQASGDFIDTTTGPNFTVEARQVAGVPTNPQVTFNEDIAAQIGTSDVAVCDSPQRLFVDRRPVNLANGTQTNLPGGGSVSLDGNGNVYLIRAPERKLGERHDQPH